MNQHDKNKSQSAEVKEKRKGHDRYVLWVIGLGIGMLFLGFFLGAPLFIAGLFIALLGLILHSRLRAVLAWGLALAFIVAVFVPQYILYSKRIRTQDAVTHASWICNAVTDWFASPDMADGDPVNYPVPPVTTVGRDGKSFQQHFPMEGLWLSATDKTSPGADPYYSFTVDTSNPSNPVVMGTARSGKGGDDIMGWLVQAGGTGVKSGLDLTEEYPSGPPSCKGNVEVYSSSF